MADAMEVLRDAQTYFEGQGVHAALAEVVQQVVEERPPDALARMAQLLALKAGRKPAPPALCSYLDTIGNTPLISLSKCLPEGVTSARVLAKLEMSNPGGSLKDRIALNMIEKAEQAGRASPGNTTLVDFTSGNTGIGEAMVAAAKGYRCIICMPQVPAMFERYIICRQFGADVHLLNPAAGGDAWVAYAKELGGRPGHLYLGQMTNEDNVTAHELHTGPEIWAQTGGQVDYFIHGIGTGGCVAGVGRYLKAQNPEVKVIALEPSEARMHTGAPMGKHGIVGWMPGFHSYFLQGRGLPASELSDAPRGVVDEWGHVSTAEAVACALKVCREEGLMVGPSAGAALKVACDVACRPEAAGKTVVVVVPSHAIRYVKHPMWAPMREEAAQALPAESVADKNAPILQWDSAAQ